MEFRKKNKLFLLILTLSSLCLEIHCKQFLTYTLTVRTGDFDGAGSNALVWVRPLGFPRGVTYKAGRLENRELGPDRWQGQTDTYSISWPRITRLTRLRFKLEPCCGVYENATSWFVETAELTSTDGTVRYICPCEIWIGRGRTGTKPHEKDCRCLKEDIRYAVEIQTGHDDEAATHADVRLAVNVKGRVKAAQYAWKQPYNSQQDRQHGHKARYTLWWPDIYYLDHVTFWLRPGPDQTYEFYPWYVHEVKLQKLDDVRHKGKFRFVCPCKMWIGVNATFFRPEIKNCYCNKDNGTEGAISEK